MSVRQRKDRTVRDGFQAFLLLPDERCEEQRGRTRAAQRWESGKRRRESGSFEGRREREWKEMGKRGENEREEVNEGKRGEEGTKLRGRVAHVKIYKYAEKRRETCWGKEKNELH